MASRIRNIGPNGEQRRLRAAAIALAGAALLTIVLLAVGAPRAWRLGLFLPLWLAGLGFFQARDKT